MAHIPVFFKSKFSINKATLTAKGQKGSIAIVVLIIGIAVVFAVSALSAYMIKDIRFTQLDEQKLKALNIAEAGVSNMFLNILKYKKNEAALPSNPYTGKVISNGVEEGTYTVGYQYSAPAYIITSKGTEINGQQRTVSVTILFVSQYNSIFSYNAINGDGKISAGSGFVGPFLTNGNIDLTNTGGYFDGGTAVINGNITTGNSSIGKNGAVDLYLGGVCDKTLTNGYSSNNIYLNNFYKQVKDIRLIDPNTVNQSGSAIVNGDLTITYDGITGTITPAVTQVGLNYFRFENNVLKISGNIVASGNINFNNTTAINYEGKGSLLSAGSISLNNNRLIPNNFSAITFPFSNNLMALVATTDINLNLSSSSGGNRTAPDVAILAISGNRATVASGKFIRGAILGKEIYSGANSEIYYENGIAEVLPGNLPVPSYFLLSQNWKEVPNS